MSNLEKFRELRTRKESRLATMTTRSFHSLFWWIGPIFRLVFNWEVCVIAISEHVWHIYSLFFFSDYGWQTWNSSWRCVSWLFVQFWCPPALLAEIHSVEDTLCATRDPTTKHGIQLKCFAPHKCQTARLKAKPANQAAIAASAPQKEDIILAWFVVHMTIPVSFKFSLSLGDHN